MDTLALGPCPPTEPSPTTTGLCVPPRRACLERCKGDLSARIYRAIPPVFPMRFFTLALVLALLVIAGCDQADPGARAVYFTSAVLSSAPFTQSNGPGWDPGSPPDFPFNLIDAPGGY